MRIKFMIAVSVAALTLSGYGSGMLNPSMSSTSIRPQLDSLLDAMKNQDPIKVKMISYGLVKRSSTGVVLEPDINQSVVVERWPNGPTIVLLRIVTPKTENITYSMSMITLGNGACQSVDGERKNCGWISPAEWRTVYDAAVVYAARHQPKQGT